MAFNTDPLYGANDQPNPRKKNPSQPGIDELSGALASQPLYPQNANQLGQRFRQDLGNTAQTVAGGVGKAYDAAVDTSSRYMEPGLNAINTIANVGRGFVGQPGGTLPSLPSFTSNAQAATLPPPSTNAAPYTGQLTRDPASETLNLASGIDAPPQQFTGVTSGALSRQARGTDLGKMVNGTPTFTYAPGDASSTIPQSYVDRTSAAPSTPYLGPEGGVGSAAAATPGARNNVLGNNTLTQEQGASIAQLPHQSGDPLRNAFDYALNAQRDAADRAQGRMQDVASGDWRSAAGTAARNAGIDRASNIRDAVRWGGPGHVGAIGAQGAIDQYDRTIGGLMGGGYQPAQDAAKIAEGYQGNVGSVAGHQLSSNARLAAAEARSDALRYGADTRAGATLGAADINANRARVNSALQAEHGRIYNTARQGGASAEEALAEADDYVKKQGQQQASTPQPVAPKGGEVRNGYRFKGGDPSDKNNWVKVQ